MDASKNKAASLVKDRKEVGIELRKTHFSLGNDGQNIISQYRQDYPEHPFGSDGKHTDSRALRKTHFKLGDHKNLYSTSTMDQNKRIENGTYQPIASLDANVKNDLRRSHFTLGNFEPNYNTMFRSEYYDKNGIKDNSGLNSKMIEKQLRNHNYVLGNDKPDYKSETAAKYTAPSNYVRNVQGISTHELQKSHYVFGNNNDPWATTSQAAYYPKEIMTKKITKNSGKTHFAFGEDKPDFTSMHHETFVPHELSRQGNINKEYAQDLRSKYR